LYRTQVRGPESLAGAGIAVLFTGAAAYAQTDEIKVYDAEINNPGQFSLELHNNYTPIGRKSADFLGGIVPNHTLNGVPEWAYGVNDWLELGAYAPVYSWTGNRRVLSTGLNCAPSSSSHTQWNEGGVGRGRDVLARAHQLAEGPDGRCEVARRVCPAGAAQPDLRGLPVPPQLMEPADLARAFPQTTIILNDVGGPLGIGPYENKKEETFAQWSWHRRTRQMPERRRQARRAEHAF
jgi:hypothetical protein